MINFLQLQIEGFGSIVKPLTFDLNQPGLNVIRGKVGSGKTSIPSALTWVLYGKTLKDKSTVETWEDRRTPKYKGTKVSVNFDIDDKAYSIIRCKNYKGKVKIGSKKIKGGSGLYIFIDGEYYAKTRTKPAAQKFINGLTGYSFDLFKNAIVFGQKMKRIIEESGPNKKKVFEEAFNTQFVQQAKELVDSELKLLNSVRTELLNTMDKLLDKMDSLQELHNNALEYEKSYKKDVVDQIALKQAELESLNKELNELSMDSKEPTDYSKKINKLSKAIKDNERDKFINKTKIKTLKGLLRDTYEELGNIETKVKPKKCSVCGSILNAKQSKQILKDNKAKEKELLKTVEKLMGDIDVLSSLEFGSTDSDKLEALRKKQAKYDSYRETRKVIEKNAKNLRSRISSLERQISKLKAKKLVIKSKKYAERLSRIEKRFAKKKREDRKLLRRIEIKQWLVKDPLSNNGIKVYIFNDLLQQVNMQLLEYSQLLGFVVEFGINMESSRKDFYQMIMKDGIIMPYEDLSGGQKQLVDTSIAFAIHAVISKLRPTNILFLDEPFESLDEGTIEIVAELITEKAIDTSLFLITHHNSFAPRNVNEITVELDNNGQTKIY